MNNTEYTLPSGSGNITDYAVEILQTTSRGYSLMNSFHMLSMT